MAADMVLVRTSVPTEDVQDSARVFQRLATVIALHDADHLGRELARVLEASDLQAGVQSEDGFRLGVDQLLLDELEGRERPVELVALQGIFFCARNAVFQRTNCSPRDTKPAAFLLFLILERGTTNVPRVVQASKWCLEALAMRQKCVFT